MGRPVIDLVGKTFGKLFVVEYAGTDKRRNALFACKCECGNIKVVRASKLKSGEIKSCGCSHWEYNPEKNEAIRKSKIKHGLSGDRLYYIYDNMMRRCYNEKSEKYNNYGARGIIVCDEWKNSRDEFFKWAIESGYKEDLTIDRIDVNGNYYPENCRWSNQKEQANNRTSNKTATYNNETHTISEWSEIVGIPAKTIYSRLKRGWTDKDALEIPVRKSHRT